MKYIEVKDNEGNIKLYTFAKAIEALIEGHWVKRKDDDKVHSSDVGITFFTKYSTNPSFQGQSIEKHLKLTKEDISANDWTIVTLHHE